MTRAPPSIAIVRETTSFARPAIPALAFVTHIPESARWLPRRMGAKG